MLQLPLSRELNMFEMSNLAIGEINLRSMEISELNLGYSWEVISKYDRDLEKVSGSLSYMGQYFKYFFYCKTDEDSIESKLLIDFYVPEDFSNFGLVGRFDSYHIIHGEGVITFEDSTYGGVCDRDIFYKDLTDFLDQNFPSLNEIVQIRNK